MNFDGSRRRLADERIAIEPADDVAPDGRTRCRWVAEDRRPSTRCQSCAARDRRVSPPRSSRSRACWCRGPWVDGSPEPPGPKPSPQLAKQKANNSPPRRRRRGTSVEIVRARRVRAHHDLRGQVDSLCFVVWASCSHCITHRRWRASAAHVAGTIHSVRQRKSASEEVRDRVFIDGGRSDARKARDAAPSWLDRLSRSHVDGRARQPGELLFRIDPSDLGSQAAASPKRWRRRMPRCTRRRRGLKTLKRQSERAKNCSKAAPARSRSATMQPQHFRRSIAR